MGQTLSCFQCCKRKNKDLNVGLIKDKYCYQCRKTFISNYEYNRHIPTCGGIYGDM